MNRLFAMLLKDALTEYAYDAELAGLKYNVEVSIYGINVSKHDHCMFLEERLFISREFLTRFSSISFSWSAITTSTTRLCSRYFKE